MNFSPILHNKVLIVGLLAWGLSQVVKIPLDYFRTRHWDWALFFTTGGMPSSHSALITATTQAAGLYYGFDDPVFALGVVITMIVTYDAAGVRREAGIHAQRLNVIFDELLKYHRLNEKELREMLGHTPLEVIGGVLFGIIVATVCWLIWP